MYSLTTAKALVSLSVIAVIILVLYWFDTQDPAARGQRRKYILFSLCFCLPIPIIQFLSQHGFLLDKVLVKVSAYIIMLSFTVNIISAAVLHHDLDKLEKAYRKSSLNDLKDVQVKDIDDAMLTLNLSSIQALIMWFIIILCCSLVIYVFIAYLYKGDIPIHGKLMFTLSYLFAIPVIGYKVMKKLEFEANQKNDIFRKKLGDKFVIFDNMRKLLDAYSYVKEVLYKIDIPIFSSFLLFTLAMCLMKTGLEADNPGSHANIAYGGLSLHVFTAVAFFLYEHSNQLFAIDIKKHTDSFFEFINKTLTFGG